MNRFTFLLLWLFVSLNGFSQSNEYSKFYYQRASLFEELAVSPSDIVFLGNSITNGNEWTELFNDNRIKNRGISGDCAKGVYDRLEPVLRGTPHKLFLLIGINDLQRGTSPDTVLYWIDRIVQKVKQASPSTLLYVQSIMPVNDSFRSFSDQITNRQAIQTVNARLAQLCKQENIPFIDLFEGLSAGASGKLDPNYTNDGLHLLGKGYLRWKALLTPYLNETPAVQAYRPTVPVLTHKEINPVLRLSIVRTDATPFSLKSLRFSLQGTTQPSDIQQIRLYLADKDGMPDTDKSLGTTQAKGGEIEFSGNLPKGQDTLTLWVTVMLKNKVDLSHRIAVSCTEVSLDNGITLTPVHTGITAQRVGIALRQQMQDNIHTCRIPGLTTTRKGTLLAIYDGRRTSSRDLQGDIDICLNRSTDGGATWQPLQVVMDKGKWGGLPEKFNGVSDACILTDAKTGTIYIAGLWMHGVLDKETGKWVEGLNEQSSEWIHQWIYKGSQPGTGVKETSQFLITKSTDDGKTWSEPVNITAQTKRKEWWLFAPAPGHGITLNDGTLVFPTQGRDENGISFSNITWSKDGGKTWTTSNPAYKDVTECMVAQLEDGSLMLNMRDNRNRGNYTENGRRICTTTDLGVTWTEHPTSRKALIEPTCMGSLHKHIRKGKSLLLFSNPANQSVRTNMTLKVSTDNGNTWPESYQTELDQYRSAGYSCITSINEDTVGILYESSQAQLVFQQISLNELLDNKPKQNK
ncbi:hypothetical protein SDC9_30167 [bioreactor metagenome]|uniref:Sialidase n=1 Tax=bioreactor metagenome TaxID=1076179 RepID=A0A644UZX3_9ZZZZ